MSILIFLGCIVLMIYFIHPDDAGWNEGKIPKGITLIGLWIAFASVLVLPYDVANSRGSGGGIRVDILWQIIYISLALLICFVIPFAYFFYESDVDEADVEGFCDSQTGQAITYTSVFAIVFITLLVIMYAFLNTAEIPVIQYKQSWSLIVPVATNQSSLPNPYTTCVASRGCVRQQFIWGIPITFPVFLMAFLAFLGWFFWTVFVGVGFVALPMDLINDYRTRPIKIPATEYFKRRIELAKRAESLVKAGTAIQKEQDDTRHSDRGRSAKRKDRQLMLRFEQAYYMLKRDKELLEASYNMTDESALWALVKLALGIIGVLLSTAWFIHIVIFVLPVRPFYPFLNNFFIALEDAGGGGFPLFGVLAYAIFGFYLLWCCVKGNFKLGLRLAFWKIYPMEVGKTKMSAFLANTWVILLCSVPTIQFSTIAFPYYARETQIDMLFGTQIQYLKFLKYFWENNVFIIAMICFMFLTGVYLFFRPADRAAEVEEKLNAIANRPLGADE